jgi:hypothetical protein
MPKPRSVKLRPLRTVRPMPSSLRHLDEVGGDAALHDEVLDQVADLVVHERGADGGPEPKHFRRPREVLYSPPPSQAVNERAVRIRPSPGSRRSMTSPRETCSKAHRPSRRI